MLYESKYYGVSDLWLNELYHHGIKGQRWGIRRFQNPDGTLTTLGKERYYNSMRKLEQSPDEPSITPRQREKIIRDVFKPIERDLAKNESYKQLRKYINEATAISEPANRYSNFVAEQKYGKFADALKNGTAGDYIALGAKTYNEYVKKHSKFLASKTGEEWKNYNTSLKKDVLDSLKKASRTRLGEFGEQESPRADAYSYDVKTNTIKKSTYNDVMDAYIDVFVDEILKQRQ